MTPLVPIFGALAAALIVDQPGGIPLRRLGDVKGSVGGLGSCPHCRVQHMSANALVGPGGSCAACVRRAAAQPPGLSRYGTDRYGAAFVLAPLIPEALVIGVLAAAAVGTGLMVVTTSGVQIDDLDMDLTWPWVTAATAIPTPQELENELEGAEIALSAAGASIGQSCRWAFSPMAIYDRFLDLLSVELQLPKAAFAEEAWLIWRRLASKFADPAAVVQMLKSGPGAAMAVMNFGSQVLELLLAATEALLWHMADAKTFRGTESAFDAARSRLGSDLKACAGSAKAKLGDGLRGLIAALFTGFKKLKQARPYLMPILTGGMALTGYNLDDWIEERTLTQIIDIWADVGETYGEEVERDGLLSFDFLVDFARASLVTEKLLRGEAPQWRVEDRAAAQGFEAYLVSHAYPNMRFDEGAAIEGTFSVWVSHDGGQTWTMDPVPVFFRPPVEGAFSWMEVGVNADGSPTWRFLSLDGVADPMALERSPDGSPVWKGTASSSPARPPALALDTSKATALPIPAPPAQEAGPARSGWASWKVADPRVRARLVDITSGTTYPHQGGVPAYRTYQAQVYRDDEAAGWGGAWIDQGEPFPVIETSYVLDLRN